MTSPRPENRASRTRRRLPWAALAVVAALAAVGGWMLLDRLDAMEARVEELRSQVTAAQERAQGAEARAARAEQAAERARQRATDAERSAEVAAEDRDQAHRARTEAETRAARADASAAEATREAEQARQRAATAEEEAAEARARAERIRRQRDAELQRLQDALGDMVETRRTALGLVMNLGEDSINFDFDEAALKPDERELLSRIAGVLLTSDGYRIQVYGHTDDVGSAEYNQRLSERRARAVVDYLVEAGIDREIISIKGFGKSKPLVEGTSDAARARNRRVEIGVIDTVVRYRAASESRREDHRR